MASNCIKEKERNYKLQRSGPDIAALLDKMDNLGLATKSLAGLMSSSDKQKLDSLGIHYGTTSYWNSKMGFIPKAGEIIIYSDYQQITVDSTTVNIPAIKIGSGNAYVQDLVFADRLANERLAEHISDSAAHTTEKEKLFWNNKLGVDDAKEVVGESLILNRN